MVARGKKDGLYNAHVQVYKGEVNIVEESSSDLWHRQLGHMSEKGLSILAKKNSILVKGTQVNLNILYL